MAEQMERVATSRETNIKMDFIIGFCKLEVGWVWIGFSDEAAEM
jgi:hypothetical protein